MADVEGLRDHLGLEVYNADTEVHIGRGNSQVLWDDLLTRGLAPLGVAVDDSHRPGQDSLRAWTVVRAPDRAPASIMAALRAGHFYASCGPEILDVHLGAPGRRRARRRRRAGGGHGHRALQPGPLDHPGGQRHQRGPAQRRALRDGPPRPAPRPRRDGRRAPPASPPGRGDRRRPAHRGESSPSPGRRPTPGSRWRTSGGAWPGRTPSSCRTPGGVTSSARRYSLAPMSDPLAKPLTTPSAEDGQLLPPAGPDQEDRDLPGQARAGCSSR